MNSRARMLVRDSAAQHMLARVFLSLIIFVMMIIAGYWVIVLEPQLSDNSRSTSNALVQSQSGLIEAILSENGNRPDAQSLDGAMSEILVLKEMTSGKRFVQRVVLELDFDVIKVAPDYLPVTFGSEVCDSCFVTSIPLYAKEDRELLGIANFYVNTQFYDEFRNLVQTRIFLGAMLMLVLLGLSWRLIVNIMKRIRQGGRMLTNLFEASPIPMMLMMPDKEKVLLANDSACDFFAVPSDNLSSVRTSQFYVDINDRVNLLSILNREGEVKQYELEVLTANGGRRWVLASARKFDYFGEVAVILGVTDVSVQKQAQQDLQLARDKAESSDRAKSEFLATMSHEIRTPMNGIMGMVQLLRRTNLNETQEQYMESIASSGDLLLALLNDVLDLSKIEAGKLYLEKSEFKLSHELNTIYQTYSVLANEKSISLSVDMAASVPDALCGDALRLRQVLINLIGNALKFTDKGVVTLKVERVETDSVGVGLKFSIIDTGIGIDSDSFGRLFDKFDQLDSGVSRRFGGTGLGLAISQRLVNAMGGNIEVTSTVGKGSQFSFSVTFELSQADNHGVDENGVEVVPYLSNLSVLVVEDVPMNRLVVRTLLENEGHKVFEATNGREAIDALQNNDVDVILMDLHMPEMDGITAVREIRNLPDTVKSTVPIIALTANILQQEMDNCMAVGMDGFVIKPFTMENLLNELSKVLKCRTSFNN